MTSDHRGDKRAVSICLIDFQDDPELVRNRVGALNVDVHKIGERRGASQTFPYNFVVIWRRVHALEPWDEHVRLLVEELGGWSKLKDLIAEIAPREAWLRIDAPILGSPYVESNGLSASTIHDMARVGLAFEISVRDFRSDELTHLPV